MRIGRTAHPGTREHALLLACAARVTAQSTARIRTAATASLDWDDPTAAADLHGVTGTLLDSLTAADVATPPGVRDRLEREAIQRTARNLQLTSQLARVLASLRARGVPALTFKGPTLAVAGYGHIGRRTFADLDVLVPRDALDTVHELMRANGYVPDAGIHRIFVIYPRAGHEEAFLPTEPGLAPVDIHVAITPWSLAVPIDTSALFARAVMQDVAGTPLLTLCPSDLLVTVVLHGVNHSWKALRCITDVDAAARRDVDWDAVIATATMARMQRMLALALLLAHDLLDTSLPPDVLTFARRDDSVARLKAEIVPRLFTPLRTIDGLLRKSWQERCREQLGDRIRCAARTLTYNSLKLVPWERWLTP